MALLVALALSASTAAGCGVDSPEVPDVPEVPEVRNPRDAAVERCFEEARKIRDPGARRTAEEGCRAAGSGDTSGVRDAAREQCLESAKNVPDPGARRRAEAACRRIGP